MYFKSPLIKIQLVHDLSRKILEQILSYEIDFGIVINPIRHPDLILKKILSTKFFVKIITNYIKTKENFSKPKTVQKLKQNGTPENQLSSMVLSEYFYFVTRELYKKKNKIRHAF